MGRLRIVSYNVHKAVGTDQRRDPRRILEVIAGLEADVAVLQEVDRRYPPRPSVFDRDELARITGLVPAPLGESEVSLGWHGNAVLVHPDLPVHGAHQVDLPGLEPRGAVRVEVTKAGQSVDVIGVHLGLLRPYRRRQLQALLEAMSPEVHRRALIAGDFNEWSTQRGLEPLSRAFDIVRPGLSFHAARPVAALDLFALGAQLSAQRWGVCESPEATRASDHLPVWIDLAL